MLVKPKLDYSIKAYSSATDAVMRGVYAIQNAAIRIATGAYRSSLISSFMLKLA